MKKNTKIFVVSFLIIAVALYLIIFVLPGMQGLTEDTMVLEYGESPVAVETDIYFVRDETLFASKESGALTFLKAEGKKVRKGVQLYNLEPQNVSSKKDSAFSEIKKAAGDDLVVTDNNTALFTAVLSFYADGYEQVITPDNLDTINEADFRDIPEAVSLEREFTRGGEPIFKLIDNTLWYMVYWTEDIKEGDVEGLINETVKVEIESTEISAVIESITDEGSNFKVILNSNMYYENMPLYRKAKANVVFSEFQGPIINPESVVMREEGPGVFVKQRNDSFKWIPVKIYEGKSTEEKLIVAVGYFIDAEGQSVRTVNYYDEILLNPKEKGYE